MRKILAFTMIFLIVFPMFSMFTPLVNADDEEVEQLISSLEKNLSELESLADILDEAIVLDYLIQKLQELRSYVETLGLDEDLEEELLEEVDAVIEEKEEILEIILTDDEGEAKELVTEYSEALDEFIEEAQQLKGEEEIPADVADCLIQKAQQVRDAISMGALNLVAYIEDVDMVLFEKLLEIGESKVMYLQAIVRELQALGVPVEVVIIEESPLVPALVILGIAYTLTVGVASYLSTRSVETRIEQHIGRELTIWELLPLYGVGVVIPTVLGMWTGFVTLPGFVGTALSYQLGMITLLRLSSMVFFSALRSLVELAILVGEMQGVLSRPAAETYQRRLGPLVIPLYAGGSNPGVVYKYMGDNQWDIISPELGYAVLSLVEYDGKLYAGTMSTSDPRGGVGRVYRYDGGATWTLVGDNMDDQVCSLAVYQGDLYAGTAWGRMRLYRYNDAPGDWTMVVNYPWDGTRSLHVSHGYLLMGDIGWDRMGHWDGSTFTPDQPSVTGSCIYDYEDYSGNVYAAAYMGRLWRSPDAKTWSVQLGYYDGNMWELEEFGGLLYMSYYNGELRASDGTTRGTLVYTAPDGIISMKSDGVNLYFGTGGEAGAYYGSETTGIASVYRYDGTNVVLISDEDEMVTGVQVLYIPD